MTKNAYDIVAPAAGPLIESMRAHGYSTHAAIADLVDNSISAGAKHIWINFYWSGSKSYVSLLDDGCGMNELTLRDAMRLGSCNPSEERSEQDLGRFGLGLKTASFSQARMLIVSSKTPHEGSVSRIWDLDHVVDKNEWQLLKIPDPSYEKLLSPLDKMEKGTIVLWDKLDKVVGKDILPNDGSAQKYFYLVIEEVRRYLSMVFHRYLDGPNPSLIIFINGTGTENRIRSWDPFMEDNPATWKTPVEKIGHELGDVVVQGYVLPHKDKLDREQYESGEGLRGWNAQQGFYIYRNRRMLVSGGWLGIGPDRSWTQEEHYRLARIRIDIPNSQDHEWQIDVKKSTARPPNWLRPRLKALAEQCRKQAREVFAHRGAYGPRGDKVEIQRAWLSKNMGGRLVYRIDRKHPMVLSAFAQALTKDQKSLFEAMLRIIEETVPVERIWLDKAEQQDFNSRPFETSDELEKRRMVQIAYQVLTESQGFKPECAKRRLKETDGFQDLGELIDKL